MGLKSIFSSIIGKSYADVTNPQFNALLRALYQFRVNSGVANVMGDNPDEYLKTGYQGNADVYAIINKIVTMGGQARLALWKIDERGKWAEVRDHQLTAFTRAANPTMKMTDFIAGSLIYKMAIGNCFWYKPTITSGVNRGKTTEIWLMPSNNVEIIEGKSWMNPIGGYRLDNSGVTQFTPEEVYHIRFFNPLFGSDYAGAMYGQSPLKAAAETISKLNQAEQTELKQFENQSPPYLLYRDVEGVMSSMTEEQRKQLQNTIKDFATSNNRRLMVLPDKFGMLQLGVSPVDLNILNSSQEGRRVLCNIYGIPSELFNDKSASTYNNMVEAKKSAWNDCIIPTLNDIATSLTAFLIDTVPEYQKSGLFFAFDYNEVQELQKDREIMVRWMRQAYWTPNEIRDATGANPFPNATMDEPWVGLGEMPISQSVVEDESGSDDLAKYADYLRDDIKHN